MWLGVLAVIVAVSFAFIKFLTGVHWRRLRDRHLRLQGELNKQRQRAQSLEGTLQVERGRRGAIEQKLTVGRRFKDELYQRLRLELPDPLVTEVRNCINHNPIPQPRGVRLFHELKIADRIAKTLQSMAVGLFEFSAVDATVRAALLDSFTELLAGAEVSYTRGQPQEEGVRTSILPEDAVVCAFDRSSACMAVVRTFIQQAPGDQVGQVRAVLLAGMNANRHSEDDVSRLFARALDQALDFVGRAPSGSLLMNQFAHDDLGNAREGVDEFDKTEHLHVFRWQLPEGADADTAKDDATAPETEAEDGDASTEQAAAETGERAETLEEEMPAPVPAPGGDGAQSEERKS